MLDTPLMLWELSVTEQRYRAVLEVLAGVPVTEAADRYGVSRQSVHAWLGRYRDEGPPGLEDRSHKVHAHPWQIPAELESAVCELRRAHRKWGPKRLVFEMGRRGHGTVTRSGQGDTPGHTQQNVSLVPCSRAAGSQVDDQEIGRLRGGSRAGCEPA